MRGYLTADDIANDIRMTRTQHKGAFLVVEGSTDSRVYENFIDSAGCQVIIAHNRDKALNTLQILEQEYFPGILAVVDADFSVAEGKSPESPNLFFTDTHDLETMIIDSPALEKVLREYGSESKMDKFLADCGKDIRSVLFEKAAALGYLRWVSLREATHLKFEDLSYQDFIDRDRVELDVQKMITKIKIHSKMPQLNEADILEKWERIQSPDHDLRQVCCGHDVVNVLSIALRKAWGTWNAAEVKPEVVERSIRLAYDSSYFRHTALYELLKEWERTHTPYQVLQAVA